MSHNTNYPRMEIFGWTFHSAREVAYASQAVCNARLFLTQPIIIRNAHIINTREELVLSEQNRSNLDAWCTLSSANNSKNESSLCHDQIIKAFWSRFFHTLKAKLKIHWNINAQLLMCFYAIKPAKHRTFVISWTTTKKFAIHLEHSHEVNMQACKNRTRNWCLSSNQLFMQDLQIMLLVKQPYQNVFRKA